MLTQEDRKSKALLMMIRMSLYSETKARRDHDKRKGISSIFSELEGYLPKGWDKLVVYLEYGNGSYSFSFHVKTGGKYTKCYDLPDVSEDALAKSFSKIDKVILKERKKEKELWSNMTMVVDNDGNMHTDFDYTDLSEGTYQFKKNWKKKYLI